MTMRDIYASDISQEWLRTQLALLRYRLIDDITPADFPIEQRCGCGRHEDHVPVRFHRRGSSGCRAAAVP